MSITADGYALDDQSDLPKVGKVVKAFEIKGYGQGASR